MENHPSQLVELVTRELILDLRNPNEARQENLQVEIRYSLGSSEYNTETKSIVVGLICEINPQNLDAPLYIKVHIAGIFEVDDEKFPMDKLDHWSKHNAPILLMPYVRENLHSLSTRAQANIILPLVVLPVFSSQKENT